MKGHTQLGVQWRVCLQTPSRHDTGLCVSDSSSGQSVQAATQEPTGIGKLPGRDDGPTHRNTWLCVCVCVDGIAVQEAVLFVS